MDTAEQNAFFCRGCAPAPPPQVPPSLPPGWERPGAIPWPDPVLRRAYADAPVALLRREGEGFTLAYPYSHAKPFPLTPLFCFARVCWMDRRPYLLFPFDPRGHPRLPP